MNIFSLLLSGASFATTLFAPSQWLIPLPYCSPFIIRENTSGNAKMLEGIVQESTVTYTPLLQGEVSLQWQVQCEVSVEFALQWNLPAPSFVAGVFQQDGRHAQILDEQVFLSIEANAGHLAKGSLTMFFPSKENDFSLTVQSFTPVWPLPIPSLQTFFPWKIFSVNSTLPTLYEVRSAVTGGVPTFADTLPVVCHTEGDLLALSTPSKQCLVAHGLTFATQEQRKLYGLRNDAIAPLMQSESFVKPNASGQVIISEVMWSGSYSFGVNLQTDQWIELYNTTGERLNLVGARLRGAKPIGDIRFSSDLLIPPKGFVIIGRERNAKTSLARNPDKAELLSLPLSGSSIQLISHDDIVLDQTPMGTWPAGKNGTTRASMQRRWIEGLGSDSSNWSDCSAQEELFRCRELSKENWRAKPGENLGTPWHPNVL
jgi:hypothetical protein